MKKREKEEEYNTNVFPYRTFSYDLRAKNNFITFHILYV